MKLLNMTFLLLAVSGLCACQNTMPRYEREFGQSVRNTMQAQIINPDASKNQDPVKGLDGRAARDSINNYQKSFTKPVAQPNVFNFGIGGGAATGGSTGMGN